MIGFKKAAVQDAQAIKDIARRVISANYTPFLGSEAITAFIESGQSDREIDEGLDACICLESKGKIVGFAITREDLLHLLMIDVSFQNRGYGSMLLRHAEQALFKAHSRICLQTFKENAPAAAFYRKNGWRIASEQWMPELNKTMLHFEKESEGEGS